MWTEGEMQLPNPLQLGCTLIAIKVYSSYDAYFLMLWFNEFKVEFYSNTIDIQFHHTSGGLYYTKHVIRQTWDQFVQSGGSMRTCMKGHYLLATHTLHLSKIFCILQYMVVFSYLFQKVAEIHLYFKEDNERQLASKKSFVVVQLGKMEKYLSLLTFPFYQM